MEEVSDKLKETVKTVVGRLESRYPDSFERSVHSAMSSSDASDRWKMGIRELFGISCETDETANFLKLNHNTASIRAEAVQSLVAGILAGNVIIQLGWLFQFEFSLSIVRIKGS